MSRFRLRLGGLFPGRDRQPTEDGTRGAGGNGGPGSGRGLVEPVSRRVTPGKVAGCGSLFSGVFLLAGLGFLAFFVLPAVRVVQARSWDPVPCEIVTSSVASHWDSDGTTYSVDVSYRYTVDGDTYTGDRYEFLEGSSSGYESKKRVVDALSPGSVTTCWVDPEDPTSAVLDRAPSPFLLVALLPLLFVVGGAGGIVVSLRAGRSLRMHEAAGVPSWMPDRGGPPPPEVPSAGQTPAPIGPGTDAASRGAPRAAAAPSGGPGTRALQSRSSPLRKLGGSLLICLIWNGVVSLFVWQLWESWQDGRFEGCLALFLVPFVLIGLLLLLGVPYQFLALFNPRPHLVVTPGRLVPGAQAELRWRFTGSVRRIRRLRIALEGREEADYTRGTDHRTAKETFATHQVVDTATAIQIESGSATLRVPADAMHSFEAPDNRILWALKLEGTIRLWPDVLEEVPVAIEPLPLDEIRENR